MEPEIPPNMDLNSANPPALLTKGVVGPSVEVQPSGEVVAFDEVKDMPPDEKFLAFFDLTSRANRALPIAMKEASSQAIPCTLKKSSPRSSSSRVAR